MAIGWISRHRAKTTVSAIVVSVLMSSGWWYQRWSDSWIDQADQMLPINPAEAERLLRGRLPEQSSGDPRGELLLLKSLAMQSRWTELSDRFQLLDSSGYPAEPIVSLASAARLAGEYALSEELLLSVIDRDRPNLATLRALIAVELFQEKYEAALLDCEQLLRIAPRDPYPEHVKSMIYFNQGDYSSAVTACQEALNKNPPDPAAILTTLVKSLIETGENLRARRALANLNAAAPNHPDAGLFEAKVLRLEGDLEKALEAVENHLSQHPDSGDGLMFRARLSSGRGDFAGAKVDLQQVLHLDPNNPQAHYLLGQCLVRLDELELAEKHLSSARRIQDMRNQSYLLRQNPSE